MVKVKVNLLKMYFSAKKLLCIKIQQQMRIINTFTKNFIEKQIKNYFFLQQLQVYKPLNFKMKNFLPIIIYKKQHRHFLFNLL